MDAMLENRKTRNEACLLDVAAMLARLNVPHSRAQDAMRLEMVLGDKVCGVAYVVSAAYLFSLDEVLCDDEEPPTHELTAAQKREQFEENFFEFQSNLFETEHDSRPRKDLYLIAVGTREYLYHELDDGRLTKVECDTKIARKRVLTLEQLESLLTNFIPLSELRQREQRPSVEVFAELRDLPGSARPPTDVLTVKGIDEIPDDEELMAPANAELRRRIDAILVRVTDGRYRVLWGSDSVNIARDRDERGCPIFFASTGERRAFALAHFLAKVSFTATPQATVALHCALHNLALLWYLGALDVLREMAVLTGASFQLQLPNSRLRELATMKLEPVASVTEYERNFS